MTTFLLVILLIMVKAALQDGSAYDEKTCGIPQMNRGRLGRKASQDIYSKATYKIIDYDEDSDDDDRDINDHSRYKVMGGTRAQTGEIPWAVFLDLKHINKLCGGTLVSKRHVLTAAHCFWDDKDTSECSTADMVPYKDIEEKLSVIVGASCLVTGEFNCTTSDTGKKFRVKRAYYEGFFESGCTGAKDIAILELSEDVLERTNHICLPFMHNMKEFEDSSLRLSSFGWGEDPAQKMFTPTPFLQKVDLGLKMPDKECKKFQEKPEGTFCTYETADKNVCNGDSGGGLTASVNGRHYIMGIVSYGSSCQDLIHGAVGAQVNTDVMYYTNLIKSWIGDKNSKGLRRSA